MSNPGLTNLSCWWKLDEESGTRYDEQTNVALIQIGGVGYSTGRHIFTNNCADFVAINSEYLYSTDPSQFLRGGDHSICMGIWVKFHDVGAGSQILCKWDTFIKEYQINLTNGKIVFSINDSGDNIHTIVANDFGLVSNETWYFIAAYFDFPNKKIAIGVNDVWDIAFAGALGLKSTTLQFRLAAWQGFGYYFDGFMEDGFFYKDRLLNSDEWTWLYNNGYGRRYEDVVPVTPPSMGVVTKRKMPEIYVYDDALNGLGIIDDYSSLNWAERYTSEGDFELELPLSFASNSLLDFGNFLYISTSDKVMIIEEKKPTKAPTEGKLLVNGRSAESILRRREQMQQHTWFAPAEYIAYHHVYYSVIFGAGDADRIIDLFEDGSGDMWPPAMESLSLISEQFGSENIYEIVEGALKIANLGFRIVVGNLASASSKLYFLVYEGVDRSSSVIFSDKFDNLPDSSFLTTQKDRINLTVVYTDDPVYDKVFVWEGGSSESGGKSEPTGLNRFEGRLDTTIDRGDVSQAPSLPAALTYPTVNVVGQKNLVAVGITTTPVMKLKVDPPPYLTDKEVLAIIEERGETVIKDSTPIVVFDGNVDARGQFVIGEDFFLGDIVTVNAHGVSDKARVMEVVKSYSVEGEKIYIAFDFEV